MVRHHVLKKKKKKKSGQPIRMKWALTKLGAGRLTFAWAFLVPFGLYLYTVQVSPFCTTASECTVLNLLFSLSSVQLLLLMYMHEHGKRTHSSTHISHGKNLELRWSFWAAKMASPAAGSNVDEESKFSGPWINGVKWTVNGGGSPPGPGPGPPPLDLFPLTSCGTACEKSPLIKFHEKSPLVEPLVREA